MKLQILGSGQDAGVPQIGCYCPNCNKARKDMKYRRFGPSLAIIDKEKKFCYLIDASPDLKYQVDMIREEITVVKRKGTIPISGILLTHAHFGHCSGLWWLGKECVDERDLPVFCSPKMKRFLQNNHPFSHLVERNNITINEKAINKEFALDELTFVPFEVPHRNEYADTVGYIMIAKKRVIYLPDLDYWIDEIKDEIKKADIAFIDGSFYSKDELPGFVEVPHPPIKETIEFLKDVNTEIYFTHFNHTNLLLDNNRKERKDVIKKGFKIAYDGLILEI